MSNCFFSLREAVSWPHRVFGLSTVKTRKLLGALILCTLPGCTSTLPALPDVSSLSEPYRDGTVVTGHVMTVLMGPTTRWYPPELRFFELVNSVTHDHIRVDVGNSDGWFILALPAGDYEVSRLQISEGAFLSMAGMNSRFSAIDNQVTYVGTWRLGVESPQYDRSILLSVIAESEDIVRQALLPYQILQDRPLSTDILTPSTVETRLYEMPPYPRFWWFRRHHTS